MIATAAFRAYPTGNFCNASETVRALGAGFQPVIQGVRIAGRAKTVRTPPGQNAAIHRAVHSAHPGDLLVVDGGGALTFGAFGDLLAETCQARGIVGGVFDCAIRDASELRAMGFQAFCRGRHPAATRKDEPGEIDVEIHCAGALVRPGDIVIGDDDGVVVVPSDAADAILERVAKVAAREAEIRARIHAGETTFEIFDLSRD